MRCGSVPGRHRRIALAALAALCLSLARMPLAAAGDEHEDDDRRDATPPVVTLLSPPEGILTDPLSAFRFWLEDPEPPHASGDDQDDDEDEGRSELDLSTIRVRVNGADRTGEAVFLEEGEPDERVRLPVAGHDEDAEEGLLVLAPDAAAPLPQGAVTITVEVADRASNPARLEARYTVDSVPPAIEPVAPQAGAVIRDPAQVLRFAITDAVTGVDPATVRVAVDGQDRTGAATFDPVTGALRLPPPGAWADGALEVAIAAADRAGNRAEARFTYTVEARLALAARPRAVPDRGTAPLAVRFYPDATTPTAIERFEWDFDGDGTWDATDVIGAERRHTYRTPGTYTAALRVTDRDGNQATGTVVIQVENAPPVVAAEAAPSNGAVPLTVAFSVTATDNEGIARYEWDFDGDGTWDYSGTATGDTTHTYTAAGTYRATVRVTDTLGASTVLTLPTTEVRAAPPGSPSVTVTATPTQGRVPLAVSFSASATDPDGLAFTRFEWDFDGDGTWDAAGAAPSATHTYDRPGSWFARVRATAADGGTAEDVVLVRVLPVVSLQVTPTDTIDPGLGELASVSTTLGGTTRVSLVVEDRSGRLVRTLLPWTERAAGTYDDPWDGRDDSGAVVAEGDYYAVLLYEVDGVVERHDLRLTTGGAAYNPPYTLSGGSFAPFAGRPLVIDFSLHRASEVNAFIGRYNVNTRLVTLLNRRPLGRGSHRLTWNADTNDGRFITPPPGDAFLFGVFAYELPRNVIYVRSAPRITGLSAAPPILDPSAPGAAGRIGFELSRPADVELVVADMETGAVVARRRFPGLPAGTNEVTWDGRRDDGTLLAPGRYRLGLTATDAAGGRSLTVYTVQRIYY